MLFILVASSVLIVAVGTIIDTDEVVRFYAKTSPSEHFEISQCVNDKPFYKYRGGQNTTVHVFVESDLQVTTLKQCNLGPTIFDPPWSVYRLNSTHQHIKILMHEIAINDDVSDLNCHVELGAGNDSMELYCTARFSNVDGSQHTTFAYLSGYTKAKISVDLNKTSVIKDIEIWDNSSMLVDCVALGNGYKHAVTERKKYGNTKVIGRDNNEYLFTLDKFSDIVEFGCYETKKNKKHKATVRLSFIETEYSANKQINKVVIFNTWMIVSICLSSIVVGAGVVTLILWRSKVLRKRKERAPMPLPELSRPESLASGHYEHIYDLPDVDENRNKEKALKIMPNEMMCSNPPAPSSLENIPSKRFNTSPRGLFTGIASIPEDSQIPASDLYLLQIDSEGYQIPVNPQLFPIISEESKHK